MTISINEIMGGLPNREDFLYVCSMTYAHWTPDDIESGETSDRGYLYCDEKLSWSDVMAELSMFTAESASCWPIPSDDQKCSFWLTARKTDCITGITEEHSFFVHSIGIPRIYQSEDYLRHGLRYDYSRVDNRDMCQLMRDAGILPHRTIKRITDKHAIKNEVK